jgi:hypothetical protein
MPVYPPPKNEGERGKFADFDVAIRRANASDDVHWSFGARGQFGYDQGNQVSKGRTLCSRTLRTYPIWPPWMAALGPAKWLTLDPSSACSGDRFPTSQFTQGLTILL